VRRLKLGFFLIAAALLLTAFATAGLNTIQLNRGVTAGIVRSDTDANVAIKFTALAPYTSYMTVNATSGVATFTFSDILLTLSGNSWSSNNTFTIGSASSGFFMITNNSGDGITVTLASATGGLSLNQVTGGTIPPGSSDTFYFSIDATGQTKTSVVGGSIQIHSAL
jgi:hypothetical protein